MAPETAKKCQERTAGRTVWYGRGLRRRRSTPLSASSGCGPFGRLLCREGL